MAYQLEIIFWKFISHTQAQIPLQMAAKQQNLSVISAQISELVFQSRNRRQQHQQVLQHFVKEEILT